MKVLLSSMVAGFLLAVVLAVGCDVPVASQTADQHQASETKKSLAEADRQIGMPDITRFTERKLAKDILELRDKEITTYCYLVNLNGELIFLGEALGFGLPYSVQYTNPEATIALDNYGENKFHASMPQADPNGLFMPSGLSATWIMLRGPDGKVHPVYIEPEIIVSPFPLHAVKVVEETVVAAPEVAQ